MPGISVTGWSRQAVPDGQDPGADRRQTGAGQKEAPSHHTGRGGGAGHDAPSQHWGHRHPHQG